MIRTTPGTSRSQGVLLTGILPQLRAACLLVAGSDPALVRNAVVSAPLPASTTAMVSAIRRFAEEHCVTAVIDQSDSRITVRLSRLGVNDVH